jgi:ribosomal protein S12 methylthiotransferase accessory factor
MIMEISFPQGDRVVARSGAHEIHTDQDGSEAAPFELFLASIGTCAGLYVSRFCQQRGIPTEEIKIRQIMVPDPSTRMIGRIQLEIMLPDDFPERYKDAVIRSAQLCAVKKHLEQPPRIEVTTTTMAAATN